MITIRTLKVSAPFSYLWLKHVTGVNLAVHCAHCLLGEYDPRIKANLTEISNIPLPDAPYHYLCGSAAPMCGAGTSIWLSGKRREAFNRPA